ncbi:hypothetical protein DPMN_167895 [Dreissena polymorpha]|uniref:Uncharacterized protein n=1 Tax=Dreissena polymorpha TaxID=45954 RepID=A0A9D4IZ56_DREPO|nr:hypothetical protein DPMN_167895 [Dreissena polymorpha]
MLAESRYSYGTLSKLVLCWDATGINRGSARALLAMTEVNRGVAVNLPGSDAGIALVSAGGVTVYRGSAGMLAAFTGAQPVHYLRQPGLCQGFTGIDYSQSAVDRNSAGLLTGFNRGGTGK